MDYLIEQRFPVSRGIFFARSRLNPKLRLLSDFGDGEWHAL